MTSFSRLAPRHLHPRVKTVRSVSVLALSLLVDRRRARPLDEARAIRAARAARSRVARRAHAVASMAPRWRCDGVAIRARSRSTRRCSGPFQVAKLSPGHRYEFRSEGL